jgi:hypothetical protein
MKIISKTLTLAYRLWLNIIETSQIRLSMNFYYIKLGLIQLLSNSLDKFKNLNLPQSQNQLRQNNSSNHKSTQIDNVRKKNKISVAIVNNRAFWVHNNTFYTSEVIEGVVDGENAIPIDAYQLSPSEISLLMNVLDEIND